MTDLGFENNLEVYETTESHQADGGYDLSYPNSPTDTVDAEITTPEEDADRDEGGTGVDADVVIYVADGSGLTFTEYGDSGQGAAQVVDTGTSTRYEIQTKTDEHNGLLKLTAVEI
jgi:hypothetical protein